MSDTDSPGSAGSDAEQLEMLRASAADVVQRGADMRRLRERRGTLPGHDPALRQQMADLGWLGMLVPEAQGGSGLGLTEAAAVVQELGKGLMADPLVPAAFATRVLWHAIARGGDAPSSVAARRACTSRLAGLADGAQLAAVAWQEDLGGLDPHAPATQAQPDGDNWRLSGSKRFVAGAAGADGFIVSAVAPNGPGLFWVPAAAAGLTLRHEWRADQTPSGVLQLDGVGIGAQDVFVAPAPDGLAALERARDDAAVLASAEMLGVMEAALQLALAYMRTRVQFGQPIGSFQALQHKAADLYVQQELVRAVLQDALRTLDGGADPLTAARVASRCKARASDAGLRVTREVIQLHGAIGFTDEHDAGLYLKRALVLSAWLGNASAHRQRFGALMDTEPAL